MVRVVKLTLLNHLFYYTEVSGGGASATITGGFLGDLALTYAFAGAMRTRTDAYEHRLQPDYPEIRQFGFYCTVGRPFERVNRTNTYIQNTLFTDGYPDLDSINKSGKSPFKNFRQVQGLSIGNEFLAVVMSKETLNLPPVIRLGRQKETLVAVEPLAKLPHNIGDEFWLNAFSLKTVFNNLDPAVKLMTQNHRIRLWNVIEPYFLIQNLTLDHVRAIFQDHFE
jgi:CRISPR-associated protein Csc1